MYEDLDINTTDNAMIPFREFVYAYYDCRRTKRLRQAETKSKIHPKSKTQEHTECINIKYQ